MKAFLIIITISFILWNCSSDQIMNLRQAKDIVKEYYESGQFNKEMQEVIDNAKKKFDVIEVKNNSVVIFDVDETALNNYGLAKMMDFGYVYEMNKKWNEELKAPAIKETQEFYFYLLKRGFKTIFLTGRNSVEYEITYRNLVQDGYYGFDTLITQNKANQELKSEEFKSKIRKELTEHGYEIIGTVGDQWTDLNGPFSGIQVKLPNYLYEIR